MAGGSASYRLGAIFIQGMSPAIERPFGMFLITLHAMLWKRLRTGARVLWRSEALKFVIRLRLFHGSSTKVQPCVPLISTMYEQTFLNPLITNNIYMLHQAHSSPLHTYVQIFHNYYPYLEDIGLRWSSQCH